MQSFRVRSTLLVTEPNLGASWGHQYPGGLTTGSVPPAAGWRLPHFSNVAIWRTHLRLTSPFILMGVHTNAKHSLLPLSLETPKQPPRRDQCLESGFDEMEWEEPCIFHLTESHPGTGKHHPLFPKGQMQDHKIPVWGRAWEQICPTQRVRLLATAIRCTDRWGGEGGSKGWRCTEGRRGWGQRFLQVEPPCPGATHGPRNLQWKENGTQLSCRWPFIVSETSIHS